MEVIEVCFSRKIVSNIPNPLFFNQSQITISESHKYLQAQTFENIVDFGIIFLFFSAKDPSPHFSML